MSEADRITTASENVAIACPECDEAGNIINRRGMNTHAGNPDHPFACGECSSTFETAIVRRTKTGWRGPKYADLSPEDVGL